ncbi:MAG TPA: type IV secretion system protein, partial [Candidatus Dormibacteraeota bacterium]|nr:type IV secretion system protein [Candidatus Dormibacteraeota bacterium]
MFEGFPATGYSSFYNDQSLDVTDWFFNDIASLLFMAVVWLGSVCVALLEWSFRLELVGDPTQPLNQSNAITQVVGHLQTDIYLPFLTTAILVAGAWVLWNGLLRKRMTVTLQAAGWVVLSIGIASIFFAIPAVAVGALDGLATQVSTTILDAVGAAEQNLSGSQNIPECSDSSTNQYCPLRQSINLYWSIYVYEPWAVAEFGENSLADSTNSKCTSNGMTLGEQQLLANASGDSTETASMANTVQNCITAVYGSGTQATSLTNWYQGKQGGSRFGIAFIAIITMLFASALLIGIAVAIILAQLGLILLSMVAPLFFLVAIHPSTGRQLFLRWAGLLLAFLMRRVLYAAFLAILLVLGSVILKGVVSESWFLGAVLQIALVILAFLYRKPFASVFHQVGSPRLAAQLVGGSTQPVQRVRNWISQRVEPTGPDVPIPTLGRQRMAGPLGGSGESPIPPAIQTSASTMEENRRGRGLDSATTAAGFDGENGVGPQLDSATKLPPGRVSRRRRLARTAAAGIAAAAGNGATLGAGTVASEAL